MHMQIIALQKKSIKKYKDFCQRENTIQMFVVQTEHRLSFSVFKLKSGKAKGPNQNIDNWPTEGTAGSMFGSDICSLHVI